MNTPQTARLLLGVGWIVAVATACPPERGELVVPTVAEGECLTDQYHEYPDSQFALSGPITRIPEFHDCQRFIVKSGVFFKWDVYGGLYSIFVRYQLGDVGFPAVTGGIIPGGTDSVGTSQAGGLAHVVGGTTLVATGNTTAAIGVAVALIHAHDKPYRPLGIRVGFNCLYLYDPAEWKAKMVPVTHERECLENVDPTAVAGTALPVRAVYAAGFANVDYPPVARWDTDGRRYFIGIKCLGAWCEIGSGESPETYAALGRHGAIKGWYDEQRLAVHTAAGQQWPTTILGTAFPDPGLDALLATAADYPPDTWVPVAHVWLRAQPDAPAPWADEFAVYHTKFKFEAGASVEETNTIEFCRGSAAGCFPQGQAAQAPTCTAPKQGKYWARIIAARTRDTTYRCVSYTNHGHTLPGVVRWRWLKNDEKNWVPCPSGCCQVDQ